MAYFLVVEGKDGEERIGWDLLKEAQSHPDAIDLGARYLLSTDYDRATLCKSAADPSIDLESLLDQNDPHVYEPIVEIST